MAQHPPRLGWVPRLGKRTGALLLLLVAAVTTALPAAAVEAPAAAAPELRTAEVQTAAVGLPTPRDRREVERLIEAQLFAGHTAARARPGAYGHPGPSLPALTWSEPIAEVARDWADQRAAGSVVGHNPHWFEQVKLTDAPGVITSGSENIYPWTEILQTRRPREVTDRFMQGWMDSDGHRRNLLSTRVDRLGIGVSVTANGTVVAVVNFAGSRDAALPPPSTAAPRWAPASPACGSEIPAGRFVDVHGPALTADVACLVREGVVRGVSSSRFAPDLAVTRGQAATMLSAVLTRSGVSLPSATSTGFTDVGARSTHGAEIRALTAAGVISGYPDGTFRPGNPVTRAQMATLLVRAYEHQAQPLAYAPVDYFRDDDLSIHERSIGQVAAAGWDPGSGEVFRPGDPVLRREAAHHLVRWLSATQDRS